MNQRTDSPFLLGRIAIADKGGYNINHWQEEPIKKVIKAMMWNSACYNEHPIDWKLHQEIMDAIIKHEMGEDAVKDYGIRKGADDSCFWTSFRDGQIKITFHLVYLDITCDLSRKK